MEVNIIIIKENAATCLYFSNILLYVCHTYVKNLYLKKLSVRLNLFKTDTVTKAWKVTCYNPTLKLTHRDMCKIENSKPCIFYFPPACHSHLHFYWYLDKKQTASMMLSATWRSSCFEHGGWGKNIPITVINTYFPQNSVVFFFATLSAKRHCSQILCYSFSGPQGQRKEKRL